MRWRWSGQVIRLRHQGLELSLPIRLSSVNFENVFFTRGYVFCFCLKGHWTADMRFFDAILART